MGTAKPNPFSVSTPGQLAQVLRGFRKAKKLTQAQVARRGGLLPKTVSAVETDPSKVTFESLYRVLVALDLDLLLREKDARPPAEW
jgi:HTH-type transcriptional regulator/antitoxin HipB